MRHRYIARGRGSPNGQGHPWHPRLGGRCPSARRPRSSAEDVRLLLRVGPILAGGLSGGQRLAVLVVVVQSPLHVGCHVALVGAAQRDEVTDARDVAAHRHQHPAPSDACRGPRAAFRVLRPLMLPERAFSAAGRDLSVSKLRCDGAVPLFLHCGGPAALPVQQLGELRRSDRG